MLIQHRAMTKYKPRLSIILIASPLLGLLSLSACQTAPITPTQGSVTTRATTAVIPVPTVSGADSIHNDTIIYAENDSEEYDSEEYVIEYDDSDEDADNSSPIQPYIPDIPPASAPEMTIIPAPVIVQPPSKTPPAPSLPPLSHGDLLERARQNSARQSQQPTAVNHELPAFQRLMETGINQLKTGQLGAAENSFTRAQRIAPKSSAVYFYLAQVALKKNQPRKAEAMARRGLSVSQDASRQRALWQIILRSGQLQNSPRVIREAQQALR